MKAIAYGVGLLLLAGTSAAAADSTLASPPVIAQAAWSPDGSWLAFVASRSGVAELQLVRRNGERRHTVFSSPSSSFPDFAWSPGSRLLAIEDRSTGIPITQIRRPDGSLVRRFEGEFGDWSPGGGRVLLVRGAPPVVHVGNVGSGAVRPLASGIDPAWSPDGKLIAFSALAGEARPRCWPTRRIFVVGADGRGLRQVSPDNDPARPGRHRLPTWSPDSRRLAYGDDPACVHIEAEADAIVVPATGTRTAIHLGVGWPTWSPKGHFLILEKTFHSDPRLSLVTARGKKRFESYGGSDARWSPLGARVVFSEASTPGQPFTHAIHVVEANGSGPRRLARGRQPTWSRGLIAFIRDTDCGDRIFLIAPNGRGLRALTPCLAP